MSKRNCLSSIVVAALFAYFFYLCGNLAESAAYWPKIICVAGLVLSCLQALLSGIQWRKTSSSSGERAFPLTWAQAKRGLILLVVIIGIILAMRPLGYLVTMTLAVLILILYFEPERTKKHLIRDVAVGIVFCGLMYGVFSLLGVNFPSGLLI